MERQTRLMTKKELGTREWFGFADSYSFIGADFLVRQICLVCLHLVFRFITEPKNKN